MKKYLRLIIEIVMGLLLAGALAFGYWSYTGKSHIMHELTDASEGMSEAQEELEKLTKELEEAKEQLEEVEPAASPNLRLSKTRLATVLCWKSTTLSSRPKKAR